MNVHHCIMTHDYIYGVSYRGFTSYVITRIVDRERGSLTSTSSTLTNMSSPDYKMILYNYCLRELHRYDMKFKGFFWDAKHYLLYT